MIEYGDLILGTKVFRQLQQDITSEHLSQAYIIYSLDELAVRLTTEAFATAIVCTNHQPYDNCAVCKRVEGGNYSDIYNINRPKVQVGDIDGLISSSLMTAYEGKHKIFTIYNAQTMNEASQNKILKTLEEPPRDVIIILAATNLSALLPTVVSRCKVVQLQAFAPSELQQALTNKYPKSDKVELAVSSSGGLLALADRMIRSDKYEKIFKVALNTLLYCRTSANVAQTAYEIGIFKGELIIVIEYLELLLRDVMMLHSGKPELISLKSELTNLTAIGKIYSTLTVLKVLPVLTKSKMRISGNGNSVSIVDEMLMKIMEEKAKCQKL